MTFPVAITLSLGSSRSGLTDLRAQLFADGGSVGSEISGSFSDLGNGNYVWEYSDIPDGFVGAVIFYSNATPSETWVDEIDYRRGSSTLLDRIVDLLEGDEHPTPSRYRKFKRGTSVVLLDKDVASDGSGGLLITEHVGP